MNPVSPFVSFVSFPYGGFSVLFGELECWSNWVTAVVEASVSTLTPLRLRQLIRGFRFGDRESAIDDSVSEEILKTVSATARVLPHLEPLELLTTMT